MSDSLSKLRSIPASPQLLTKKLRDNFNQLILETYGPVVDSILSPTPVSDVAFGVFLTSIVSTAKLLLQRERRGNTLLDLQFQPDIAARLCEQHPQLRDIIRAACKEGKFYHIVNLQILQAPHLLTNRFDFASSFKRPYVGEAVDDFFEYLSSNNNIFKTSGTDRPYYGKFCSIVQSSGTGKSRLLTELRRKGVITLYMNICDNYGGFPKPDKVPSEILTDDLQSEAEYTIRCYAFFAAIFATIEEALKPLPDTSAIASWTDQMCDMMDFASMHRVRFFSRLKLKYSTIYSQITAPEQVETGSDAETSRPAKKWKASSGIGSFRASGAGDPRSRGEALLRSEYGNMLKTLKQKSGRGNDPKLLIGIDEAHSLSKINSMPFRPLNILCKVIHAYSRDSKESIWVAFVSTNSCVANFSAPHQIPAGFQLFPSYTCLGWDQDADAIDNIPANKVASFRHIAGFGRPLWKSLMAVDIGGVDEIFILASQKLRSSISSDPSLATLSQRFALDVCFGHPEAVAYIEKGVASHLRVCYATVEDRTWSFTGYPSEPLVSCAAAHMLHQDISNLTMLLWGLKEKVDDGLFEIGQSGELSTRLLLLLAKDTYVRRKHPKHPYTETQDGVDKWSVELIDCQQVSIVEFLEYLFGESFWVKAGDAAKESFRHAYVNFSHWVTMDEFISSESSDKNSCSAEEWTLRHWHRTSAVQCCLLQPLVDKMIPIFFDDPTLPSDMERMSQMFVSDRARRKSNEKETDFITRTHDSIECSSPLPFIALVLDLNGETKLDVTFPQKQPGDLQTDQCLRIYASGLSRETFPFLLRFTVEKALQDLVSKPKQPTSSARLQAHVKYGRTAQASHMRWEDSPGISHAVGGAGSER